MKNNNIILEDWNCVKVITSLLVILGHATFFYTDKAAISPLSSSSTLNIITQYIYSFHMPLFIAVSGAVYFHCKRILIKYEDTSLFIKVKILRLLIPYSFFAIAVVAPLVYYMKLVDNDISPIKYLINNFILGDNPRYLWYILALFNISVLFNLIEGYVYRMKFIFSFSLFFILFFGASVFPSALVLKATFSYLLYFYLGYMFQKNKELLLPFLNRTSTITILVFLSLISFILSLNINADTILHQAFLKILTFVSSITGGSLFYLIAYQLLSTKFTKTKFYKTISKSSYGLYLFHPMIIYLVFYYTKNILINPFLLVAIACVISITLSLLFIKLFRFLNLYILIGESKPKMNK